MNPCNIDFQMSHRMPGMVSECNDMSEELALPDIFHENQWKKVNERDLVSAEFGNRL